MEGAASQGTSSERIQRLKEKMISSPYSIDLERARVYTKVFKETEGSSPCMRAAKALDETLRAMTIRIEDGEKIAGVKSAKPRSDALSVERGSLSGMFNFLLKDRSLRDALKEQDVKAPVGGISSTRSRQLIESLSEDERLEFVEKIFPYWKDKTYHRRKMERLKKEGVFEGPPMYGPLSVYRILKGMGGVKGLKKKAPSSEGKAKGKSSGLKKLKTLKNLPGAFRMLHEAVPDTTFLLLDMQGHIIPGYNKILEIGFNGISQSAEKELRELDEEDPEYEHQKDFLDSVVMTTKAVGELAGRYAKLAEEKAAKADDERKQELLEIAERCRRVPAEPPRNLMEALQSMWMSQVALSISYGVDNVFSPGRVDQYLYPFYKADIEAGRITRQQAVEAVEEYLIKVSDNLIFGPNNLTIGGLGRNGNDATNEISYVFIEALENIRAMGNGLAVRISPETPRGFLRKACEVHRTTAGVAFYNDGIVIRDLLEDGYSVEDARDYSIVGCVEPTSTGNCLSYTAGNALMLVGVLEMALNRGTRLFNGSRRVGVVTPDPGTFRTFEDVKNAFVEQLAFTVERIVKMSEIKDRVFAEAFPTPLLSSTVEGCIESGKDLTRGGAQYNHGHVNAQGLATVANSLAAIKWAVFDEKMLTMGELVKHLRNNFTGAETLRQKLLRKAPKFGNGDARVDEIAEWVSEVFCSEVRKYKTWRGGIYRPSMFSSGTQDMEGALCGATPDGRLAGEVISNGISPANGTEMNGPTAVFHSVAQAGKALYSDGTALNMNLSPGMLKSDDNIEKLASLIEGYFQMGGRHVQFNPLDAKTLRDAQAHPDMYPDLTVKVTGYSACFVDLGKTLQDDIIARTEFCEL